MRGEVVVLRRVKQSERLEVERESERIGTWLMQDVAAERVPLR